LRVVEGSKIVLDDLQSKELSSCVIQQQIPRTSWNENAEATFCSQTPSSLGNGLCNKSGIFKDYNAIGFGFSRHGKDINATSCMNSQEHIAQ
jgi:hypothetical protein